MRYGDVADRLGERFTMRLPDGTARDLELVECVRTSAPAGSISYRLTFLLSGDGPPQGSYGLGAAGLNPEPVFLVPVKQRPDGIEYEAIFNQLDEQRV